MSGRVWNLRLPLPDWPAVTVESAYGGGETMLRIEGRDVLCAQDRDDLRRGVSADLDGRTLRMKLDEDGAGGALHVEIDGIPAVDESSLSPRASRTAWRHALLVAAASLAGFIASYLYLERAYATDSVWSLKMAYHMAGWHLVLTLVLAPAVILFGRIGIRFVQGTAALFFAIHLGIAISNALDPASLHHGGAIALWNAVSGLFFLAAVPYGNVAWRDMDPVLALKAELTR